MKPDNLHGNILEYNGIYYRIGEGHKEFIPDKAMDEEYYLLTLMAIARELNVFSIREADVHLAAGLPLTWIRTQREAFRSYLLQNPEVHLFNGKEYHLHFVGCSLYPQGYPAIVNQLRDFKGTNLLADIGNGTMNILYINNKKAQERGMMLDRKTWCKPMHDYRKERCSGQIRSEN